MSGDSPYTEFILEQDKKGLQHDIIKLADETPIYYDNTDWDYIAREIGSPRLEAAKKGQTYQAHRDDMDNYHNNYDNDPEEQEEDEPYDSQQQEEAQYSESEGIDNLLGEI